MHKFDLFGNTFNSSADLFTLGIDFLSISYPKQNPSKNDPPSLVVNLFGEVQTKISIGFNE